MSHEYDLAISEALLEAAASRAALAASDGGSCLPDERASAAVHDIFCPCVTDAEDAIEQSRSAIHTALIDEVRARAARLAASDPKPTPDPDLIDIASEHSFPASDPPSWIWRRTPAGPASEPASPPAQPPTPTKSG